MDSILTSIKKLLGIAAGYTYFDDDIIIHINSAFSTLAQLGIGPRNGFSISGSSETWNQFIADPLVNSAKSYVYISVKLLFDPPTSSAVIDSYNKRLEEIAWRLSVSN